jgi:plastocyanin
VRRERKDPGTQLAGASAWTPAQKSKKGTRNMKLASVMLLGLGALVLAGCGSSTPQEDVIIYEATNPATVVVEENGDQYVYLTEGPAYFAEDSVHVNEGTIVFYVTNDADRDVTLVVAPMGVRDEQRALFRVNVPKHRTATHKVQMKPGLYEYCCPVNHTEWYPLEVHAR